MGINADNHEICKFGSVNDSGYRAVAGAIMDYLQDILHKGNIFHWKFPAYELTWRSESEASTDRAASQEDTMCPYEENDQVSSKEDVAAFVTESQTLLASPYGSKSPGRGSLGKGVTFRKWHGNCESSTSRIFRWWIWKLTLLAASIVALGLVKMMQFLSAIGLSDLKPKTHETLSLPVEETDLSAQVAWFFDNPDFIDWDCCDSTEILQLSGYSKYET